MSDKQLEIFAGASASAETETTHSMIPFHTTAARRLWRHGWRWFAHHLAGIARRVALGLATLMCLVLAVFGWLWATTPSTGDLMSRVHALAVTRQVAYTPLTAITPTMAQAVIAVEDEHFYQHHGIDTLGLLRATVDNLRAGRLVEGGSTITAQLAKLVYLHGYDHDIPRKAQDLVLALKIEQHYSKTQIMEMYLNVAYYGENAYGIGAAAQHYFGVPPARLDLAQAALLAGMLQAPGAYDPWCHAALARSRQQAVLTRMVVDGYINAAQADVAARQVLPFWSSPPPQHACAA